MWLTVFDMSATKFKAFFCDDITFESIYLLLVTFIFSLMIAPASKLISDGFETTD